MFFVFKLFDSDNDIMVNSKDIGDFLENVLSCPMSSQSNVKSCQCRLFKEFDKLYKEYVHQNLTTYRVRKHLLDFEFYLREVQYSCLIEEFIDKLLLYHDRPSIFSHEHSDMALLETYFQLDSGDNLSKVSQIQSYGYSHSTEKCMKAI